MLHDRFTLSSHNHFCTLCPNKDKCSNPRVTLNVCFVSNLFLERQRRLGVALTVSSGSVFVIITPQYLLSDRYCLLIAGLNYRVSHVGAGGAHTRAHFSAQGRLDCAAVKTRDGGKREWEGWPQWRGGYVYLYTKWCMCRPRTTQLDPVSVNTDAPPSDTHEHSRGGNRLAPDTFFFSSPFTPPLLSLFLHPLLSRDLLHSSGWAFLKLQVWS